MPELPETETIARDLDQLVRGREIEAARVRRPDVLRGTPSRRLNERLAGRTIVRTWRRAKLVILDLDNETRILVQPRFTGSLREVDAAAAPTLPYGCVTLELSGHRALVYADVRRLGTFEVADQARFQAILSRLGVEPLDPEFTKDRLSGILRESDRFVKIELMDQRRIAGCGNIYANESLWMARLDPSRRANSLAPGEISQLRSSLVGVLSASIEHRGTTFRDYRDARGDRGGFAEHLAVYGRALQPCRRCGTRLLATHAIDGRSTVICFRCQR